MSASCPPPWPIEACGFIFAVGGGGIVGPAAGGGVDVHPTATRSAIAAKLERRPLRSGWIIGVHFDKRPLEPSGYLTRFMFWGATCRAAVASQAPVRPRRAPTNRVRTMGIRP